MNPELSAILLALIASPVLVEVVRAIQGKRPLVRKLRRRLDDWADWWSTFRRWSRDHDIDLTDAPQPPTDETD